MSKITDGDSHYRVATGGEYIAAGKIQQEPSGDNDFMEALKKRKEEILEKVKKGETEPSFQLGAQTFTVKQWNKLVERIDEAIDDIQETAQQKKEQQEEQVKEKKADSITLEMLAELLGCGIYEGGKDLQGKEL